MKTLIKLSVDFGIKRLGLQLHKSTKMLFQLESGMLTNKHWLMNNNQSVCGLTNINSFYFNLCSSIACNARALIRWSSRCCSFSNTKLDSSCYDTTNSSLANLQISFNTERLRQSI